MVKVSVVIPIYNVQRYIKYLLQDLSTQDFEDVEYILINDGSTDQTLKVINLFLYNLHNKKHSYRLISTPNRGVSSARNIGIENAKGEYIMFIDSDDRLKPNLISSYVKKIESNKTDLEMFSLYKNNNFFNPKDNNKMDYSDAASSGIISSSDFFKYIIDFKLKTYMTTVILKRQLLQNIKFNKNIKIWEDFLFLCTIATHFPDMRIHINNEAYYYYYQRTDSALHTMSLQDNEQCVEATNIVLKNIQSSPKLATIYPYFLGFKSGVIKAYISDCIRQRSYKKYEKLRESFIYLYPRCEYLSRKEKINRRIQYLILKMHLPTKLMVILW